MTKSIDESFSSFPISQVFPNENLPGDLYLFVSGHFVKYKNEGDQLSSEKYDDFLLKGVQYIFVLATELENYKKWYRNVLAIENEKWEKVVGESNLDFVHRRQEIKENYLNFITSDVREEEMVQMLDKCRSFVEEIARSKIATSALAKLSGHSLSLADHSVNVANLSVFFAHNLGFTHQIILENIYLGALLHDVGKTKVDPEVLDKRNSPDFDMAMGRHPDLGVKELESLGNLNDEVLKIVLEHHEQFDGGGYPEGLKGAKIYELTKIVSIANIFDNYISAESGTIQQRQSQALKRLKTDSARMFDPKKLEKCIHALETVIGQ